MDTDPKSRLAEIRARLAELQQERQALLDEREQLRQALGRGPRSRSSADESETTD